MNGDVNQADKSRYTEQVSGGVLTTASLRGRERISRRLRMRRNKWEGDNEKTKQINVTVKWQQSLCIIARRLFSFTLKGMGNKRENWTLNICGQKGGATLSGL